MPETAMNISYRSAFVFVTSTLFLAAMAVALQEASAQTPGQMEYERQQREYRQQQEQQRLEQQRQQQLMNENARRQQEESRQLNAPMGQSPVPGSQGGTPQQRGVQAQRQAAAQSNATSATAGAKWESSCQSKANGGTDIYVAPSTISRSGDVVKMWNMFEFKTVQVADRTRYFSTKNQHEFDCKRRRMRMLSTTGYAGHMGNGSVVAFDNTPFPWESPAPGGFADVCLLKAACAQK